MEECIGCWKKEEKVLEFEIQNRKECKKRFAEWGGKTGYMHFMCFIMVSGF